MPIGSDYTNLLGDPNTLEGISGRGIEIGESAFCTPDGKFYSIFRTRVNAFSLENVTSFYIYEVNSVYNSQTQKGITIPRIPLKIILTPKFSDDGNNFFALGVDMNDLYYLNVYTFNSATDEWDVISTRIAVNSCTPKYNKLITLSDNTHRYFLYMESPDSSLYPNRFIFFKKNIGSWVPDTDLDNSVPSSYTSSISYNYPSCAYNSDDNIIYVAIFPENIPFKVFSRSVAVGPWVEKISDVNPGDYTYANATFRRDGGEIMTSEVPRGSSIDLTTYIYFYTFDIINGVWKRVPNKKFLIDENVSNDGYSIIANNITLSDNGNQISFVTDNTNSSTVQNLNMPGVWNYINDEWIQQFNIREALSTNGQFSGYTPVNSHIITTLSWDNSPLILFDGINDDYFFSSIIAYGYPPSNVGNVSPVFTSGSEVYIVDLSTIYTAVTDVESTFSFNGNNNYEYLFSINSVTGVVSLLTSPLTIGFPYYIEILATNVNGGATSTILVTLTVLEQFTYFIRDFIETEENMSILFYRDLVDFIDENLTLNMGDTIKFRIKDHVLGTEITTNYGEINDNRYTDSYDTTGLYMQNGDKTFYMSINGVDRIRSDFKILPKLEVILSYYPYGEDLNGTTGQISSKGVLYDSIFTPPYNPALYRIEYDSENAHIIDSDFKVIITPLTPAGFYRGYLYVNRVDNNDLIGVLEYTYSVKRENQHFVEPMTIEINGYDGGVTLEHDFNSPFSSTEIILKSPELIITDPKVTWADNVFTVQALANIENYLLKYSIRDPNTNEQTNWSDLTLRIVHKIPPTNYTTGFVNPPGNLFNLNPDGTKTPNQMWEELTGHMVNKTTPEKILILEEIIKRNSMFTPFHRNINMQPPQAIDITVSLGSFEARLFLYDPSIV